MLGNTISRYRILDKLGEGGMGVVYRAHDERLGKVVALKVLSARGSISSEDRARFKHEARAAAILNHPSIVTVFDYDEYEGTPYIVYEYVEGETLDRLIVRGSLTEAQVIDISGQLASGLSYAHERGILHRDVKPQNLIVTAEGRSKILDFGLAKRTELGFAGREGGSLASTTIATAVGKIMGTVQYMSPEQIAGESLDGRSDLFSLGVVIYEMAFGKNPFLGPSVTSTIGKIMSADPFAFDRDNLKVSVPLREIISRCLQKKKEERYSSAQQLQQDLAKCRAAHSIERPVSRTPTAPAADQSVIPRPMARTSLILLQILYLALYGFALVYYTDVIRLIGGCLAQFMVQDSSRVLEVARIVGWALLVSGCCGIPIRLYMLASVGFDDPETGSNFRKLFPFLFPLDEVWALTPLLMIERWREGVPLICVALLAYLPISHRNLVHNAYPSSR